MEKEKYNGWTNYETWRVFLEFFDAMDPHEIRDNIEGLSLYEMGQHAKETVHEFIYSTLPDENNRGQLTPQGMVSGWARAFTDAVNWKEVAEHLAETAGVDVTE